MNNNNITLSYDLLTKGDYVKNGNDLIISHGPLEEIVTDYFTCLLYTSDAADE